MLKEYGHFSAEWRGKEYIFIPSFTNIASVSEPSEIIRLGAEMLKNDLNAFANAVLFLQSCGTPKVDDKLTGFVKLSEWSGNKIYVPGAMAYDDVLVLGRHLFNHGVVGVVPSGNDPNTKGEPITEFDACRYIEAAMIHLRMTAENAEKLTMTQFIRLLKTKVPDEKDDLEERRKARLAEEEEMLSWGD